MKNNLVTILGVLLIVTVVLGVYFYTSGQSKIKTLQTELDKAQSENKNLKDAKAKGLAYAEYADVLIWPALKDIGATPRFNFKDNVAWLLELENRIKNLNDSELEDYLGQIKANDQDGFILSVDRALGGIETVLK